MGIILDNIEVDYQEEHELNCNDISSFTQDGAIRHRNNILRRIKIFLLVFFLTMAFATLAAVLLFKMHYKTRLFLNTYINNIDMSNLTAEQVHSVLDDNLNNYFLMVLDKNGSEVMYITKDDVGLTISHEKVDEFISEILSEQKLKDFFDWKDYKAYDINILDKDKLLLCIQESDVFTPNEIILPQDAYIKFDGSLNKFVIVPSVLGNELQQGIEDILESKLLHTESTMDLFGLYARPQITDDNEILIHNLNLYNEYLPGDYTIDMDGAIETLAINEYHSWLVPNYIGDDESNALKKINTEDSFTIDAEKLKSYMDYLYKKYNTFGSVREFVTTSGRNIRITQGDYGWWLNYKETSSLIQEVLLNKDTSNQIEALYYQKAARRGGKDYGNSYVEIDLASQYLWLYNNGQRILSSDIVTGKPSAGNATPPGIYSLTYKQRDATLNGPGYSTPVSYWMPFNKHIGLHDANWQSSFGGNRYLTHGSNGCVNLPFDIAKKIFSYVEKEFPIILY